MEWYDIALFITYGLLGLGVVAAIIAPVITSISDPKSLLRAVAGVVVLAVLFFIGYALSTDEVSRTMSSQGVSGDTGKTVGAALITMYVLFGLALLNIVFSEIYKLVK